MKKIIFAALFIFTAINAFAQEVPFTLEITNVRSDKGNIMVGICSTEDQFLEKDKCTYTLSVPASKGTIVQNLNIAKGKYAIIIYHDENNNKILDRAMFGKPQEYYGFSNNKYGSFGSKPEFSEALINIDGKTNATVKLRK